MSTALIWIIMIAVMAASYIIQNSLQRRFDKYAKIPTSTGLSGAEIARKMLQENGIYDVKVESVPGKLTDHYNPQTKTVNLSAAVYDQRSIAAAAVAAHECGHVIQHAKGYAPLRLRTAMVPIVNFSSMAVQWVLLAGLLLVIAVTTLFSFVTLPVEVDASRRAVAWLEGSGIADVRTKPMAQDALKWAAYTYVIAAIGSLATLIYYISIANSRR